MLPLTLEADSLFLDSDFFLVSFQVQGMRSPSSVRLQQPSIFREASRIVREEGVRALWKGNAVTICHRLPYSAINFFAYEKYKKVGRGKGRGGGCHFL